MDDQQACADFVGRDAAAAANEREEQLAARSEAVHDQESAAAESLRRARDVEVTLDRFNRGSI